jgi:hypothetical protein
MFVSIKKYFEMRYQVLTTESVKMTAFSDIAQCSLVEVNSLPWWWRQYAPLKRLSSIAQYRKWLSYLFRNFTFWRPFFFLKKEAGLRDRHFVCVCLEDTSLKLKPFYWSSTKFLVSVMPLVCTYTPSSSIYLQNLANVRFHEVGITILPSTLNFKFSLRRVWRLEHSEILHPKQYTPLKRRSTTTKLHGAISQKALIVLSPSNLQS